MRERLWSFLIAIFCLWNLAFANGETYLKEEFVRLSEAEKYEEDRIVLLNRAFEAYFGGNNDAVVKRIVDRDEEWADLTLGNAINHSETEILAAGAIKASVQDGYIIGATDTYLRREHGIQFNGKASWLAGEIDRYLIRDLPVSMYHGKRMPYELRDAYSDNVSTSTLEMIENQLWDAITTRNQGELPLQYVLDVYIHWTGNTGVLDMLWERGGLVGSSFVLPVLYRAKDDGLLDTYAVERFKELSQSGFSEDSFGRFYSFSKFKQDSYLTQRFMVDLLSNPLENYPFRIHIAEELSGKTILEHMDLRLDFRRILREERRYVGRLESVLPAE